MSSGGRVSSPSPLRPRGGTRQLRHPGATDGDGGTDEGGSEAWNKMNLLALASMMADTGNGRPPAAAAAASGDRANGGTKAAASAADDGTPAGSSPLHEAEVKVEAATSGEAPRNHRQQQQAS